MSTLLDLISPPRRLGVALGALVSRAPSSATPAETDAARQDARTLLDQAAARAVASLRGDDLPPYVVRAVDTVAQALAANDSGRISRAAFALCSVTHGAFRDREPWATSSRRAVLHDLAQRYENLHRR